MYSIVHEAFLRVVEYVSLAKSHPKVVVLGNVCRWTVRAHLIETLLADKDSIVGDGTNERDNFFNIPIMLRKIILFKETVPEPIDEYEIGSDDIGVWMSFEVLKLRFQPFGKCNIITIEVGDIGSTRDFESTVPRVPYPLVRLILEKPDPRILPGILFDNDNTPVMRSIIDDDALEMGVCLSKDAFQTCLQIICGIIHRKNDGDEWIISFWDHFV